MSITLDNLKSLATKEGLKYFLAPDRPALLMGFSGLTGSYQVVMVLELEGRFLQFRTIGYASCPVGHPHLDAVLRVLGSLDYKLRLTKFGWDPSDGEIVGYVDLWLEDGSLTQKQFASMLAAFLPAIDMGHERIARTIETGVDPGGFGSGTGDEGLSRIRALLAGKPGDAGGPRDPGGTPGLDNGPDRI